MSVISAPLDWVELVSDLRLPPKADRRLQDLMDRNTEGQLTAEEAADLEYLVEFSQTLSLVRAEALRLLGAIQSDLLVGRNPASGRRACRGAVRVLSNAPSTSGRHFPRRTYCAAVSGWRFTTGKPCMGMPRVQSLQVEPCRSAGSSNRASRSALPSAGRPLARPLPLGRLPYCSADSNRKSHSRSDGLQPSPTNSYSAG